MFSLKDSGIKLTLGFYLDLSSIFDPGQKKLRGSHYYSTIQYVNFFLICRTERFEELYERNWG